MKSIKADKVPELVEAAASAINLDQETTTKLIDKIKDDLPEEPAEEKAPKKKQQFAVLVSDPEGVLKDKALSAWVFTLPEEDSPYIVKEWVEKAAWAFNATKKGRLIPANTIGEALEAVPAKFFKEFGLSVKTKMPVIITTTDNTIGEAPSV